MTAASLATPALGSIIAGRYRLERVLGAGGMGVVFAGTHLLLDRPVAVKLLHGEYAREPELRARFLREARAAAKLRHPFVVEVFDVGEAEDGSVFLVLELLSGKSLASVLAESGPLSETETIALLGPVVEAIAHAHANGFVHRDLKPDNVFISVDASGRRVPKVLDFGIAKALGGNVSAIVATRAGAIIGTPTHMSPEQAHANEVGPASDVWSLGILFYECLAGRIPYDIDENTSLPNLLFMVAYAPIKPVAAVVPTASPGLAALVDRCLVRELGLRIANARVLADALSRIPVARTETIPSALVDGVPRASSLGDAGRAADDVGTTVDAPATRRRTSTTLAVIVAALALIGAAATLVRRSTTDHSRPSDGSPLARASNTSPVVRPTPAADPSRRADPPQARPAPGTNAVDASLHTEATSVEPVRPDEAASSESRSPRIRPQQARSASPAVSAPSSDRTAPPHAPRVEPDSASRPRRRCEGEVVNGVCMSLD